MGKNRQNPPKMGIAAKRMVFLECHLKNMFNISATCRQLGISRQTFYNWMDKNEKFKQEVHELEEACDDMVEQALRDNAVHGRDTIAQIFYCKTKLKKRGYVEGNAVDVRQEADAKAVELLSALIAGDSDVKTTALEFTKAGIPLPEAIKILLSKEPPEEDDPDDITGMPSEEELEERGRKALEDHENQIKRFVPERKAEVEKIKAELADQDSFSEENLKA